MHTILGANGIIGEELARELNRSWTSEIRIVGRNPKRVNERDSVHRADLRNRAEVKQALTDTNIAYLTVGLPYNSKIWSTEWEIIMNNVISGCIENYCKLVYFDNTYAYPQDAVTQTEETPLSSTGMKGIAKANAAQLLVDAMDLKKVEAVICRAPEFYGPGKTKGITNTLIFESLRQGKKPKVLLNDRALRTLIYTPDASKAMALIGNTPDAFGTTWHLPCDDHRLTYKEFIAVIAKELGQEIKYMTLNRFMIDIIALFNSNLKETKELLPRYAMDNIFVSDKFKQAFPAFNVTSYEDGIREVIQDYNIR